MSKILTTVERLSIIQNSMKLEFEGDWFEADRVMWNPNECQIFDLGKMQMGELDYIREWCYTNCKYENSSYSSSFYFHKDEDTTEFIMRFL